MFENIINAALINTIEDFQEILLDEGYKNFDWATQRKLCLTLLELAEELVTSYETVTIYKPSEEFNHKAQTALPYKAALCAKLAYDLTDDVDLIEKAKSYFSASQKSIDKVVTTLPPYAHPYTFNDIENPPVQTQSLVI